MEHVHKLTFTPRTQTTFLCCRDHVWSHILTFILEVRTVTLQILIQMPYPICYHCVAILFSVSISRKYAVLIQLQFNIMTFSLFIIIAKQNAYFPTKYFRSSELNPVPYPKECGSVPWMKPILSININVFTELWLFCVDGGFFAYQFLKVLFKWFGNLSNKFWSYKICSCPSLFLIIWPKKKKVSVYSLFKAIKPSKVFV